MQDETDNNMTFQNSNSWMVQCLSLATIGMLAYMQISPVIMST